MVRDLDAAHREETKKLAEMQATANAMATRMGTIGRQMQQSFTGPLLTSLAEGKASMEEGEGAPRQAEAAGGDLRNELLLLPAEFAELARSVHQVTMEGQQLSLAFGDIGD